MTKLNLKYMSKLDIPWRESSFFGVCGEIVFFSCNKIRKGLNKIRFSVHLCVRIRQRFSYIRIQCFRLAKRILCRSLGPTGSVSPTIDNYLIRIGSLWDLLGACP